MRLAELLADMETLKASDEDSPPFSLGRPQQLVGGWKSTCGSQTSGLRCPGDRRSPTLAPPVDAELGECRSAKHLRDCHQHLDGPFNPGYANLLIESLRYKGEFISPNVIYTSVLAASLVARPCLDTDSMVIVAGMLLGVDGRLGDIPVRITFCNPTVAASLCIKLTSWGMTFSKPDIRSPRRSSGFRASHTSC